MVLTFFAKINNTFVINKRKSAKYFINNKSRKVLVYFSVKVLILFIKNYR